MKAIIQERYGSADALTLGEIEMPQIGEREVLVRVAAADVNRGVWHLMTGKPYLLRLMGFGLRKPKQRVPGDVFAGRVESVGDGVTRFQSGDRVFGSCDGSYAEYVRADEQKLAPIPARVSFAEAASVPESAATALKALRAAGADRGEPTVLIIGASGGVGSFAVQIARAFGCEVTGVCSTGKIELVRSAGAHHVIDYTTEEITTGGRRYDVILDIGGNRSFSLLRSILAPKGTLIFVGGEDGGPVSGGLGRQLRASLRSAFTLQTFRMIFSIPTQEDLFFLKELIETEKLKPILDRTYPLEQAGDALRRLERGEVRGKVVLTVDVDR